MKSSAIHIIVFLISNITFVFFFFWLIFTAISLLLKRRMLDSEKIMDIVISWYILFNIAIHHLYSAFFLIFYGKYVAAAAEWTFSPFTTEVGFANLSFSIVAFIAFKASRSFQNAVVLVTGFFLLGAFCGHLYQYLYAAQEQTKIAGFIAGALFLPIVSYLLIYIRFRIQRKKNEFNI